MLVHCSKSFNLTSADMTPVISNMCTHTLNKTSVWCINTACGVFKKKCQPCIYIMTKLNIHSTQSGAFELLYAFIILVNVLGQFASLQCPNFSNNLRFNELFIYQVDFGKDVKWHTASIFLMP